MPRAPHFVRFARALALASTVSGTAGCYQVHELVDPSARPDAARADAATFDSGPPDCRARTCECPRLASDGTCSPAWQACCPIVGPLSPPDLARALTPEGEARFSPTSRREERGAERRG